jgi:hypothetical protein
MAEPISITQRDSKSEQLPDRPRYDPPRAVHLGNSHQGRGQLFCSPVGTSDFMPFPCENGEVPAFCVPGAGFD